MRPNIFLLAGVALLLCACSGTPSRDGGRGGGTFPEHTDREEALQEPPRPRGRSFETGGEEVETVPPHGGPRDGREGRGLDSIAEGYYRDGLSAFQRGDISEALDLLARARARFPESRRVERALRRVEARLESEIHYAQETIQRGKGIPTPLQFLLLYESEGETLPVSDMPVRFRFLRGAGSLTAEAVTNDLGIAKCYVERITEVVDSLVIEARVEVDADGSSITLDSLTRLYRFNTLSILEIPHSLILPCRTRSAPIDLVAEDACESILAPFTRRGYTRTSCELGVDCELFARAFELDKPALRILGNQSGARVLILFDLSTEFVSQPSPDFFFTRADAAVKIVDTEDFQLYFESRTSERGAGPTLERSELQAVSVALDRCASEIGRYLDSEER